MADMSFSFDVQNPNSVEVEARARFFQINDFGLEENPTTITLSGSRTPTQVIAAGATGTFTFTFTAYEEDDRFSVYIDFVPTAADEDSYTQSFTQQVVESAYIKPFTAIAQNYILEDGGNGTGADWGLDFTVQGGTECTNEVEGVVTQRDPSKNYPIEYNTQEQHEVEYTLISGSNMQPQSGSSIGIGQGPEVRIAVEEKPTPLWNRKIIRMYEDTTYTGASQNGTFDIRTEIRVKNPIKNEWSVYNPRITVTETYSWSITT